jgi:serine/threonine-protein kinase
VADLRSRLAAALADRYVIEREVGSGGAAIVYLAHDLKHARNVALKVLRPELGASLGAERFLREIRIAAGLNHPHILAVHDSGQADHLLYYVMPYVEGESLRDRLRREGPLPVDEALRIAREVADALSYAHSRGVVHRDIKPGNILLIGDHAVVADFGIAVAAGSEPEALTDLGLAIGTPAYMSPEQGGHAGPLDGRTDLYSLGCVLYEMLTGAPPFTGPSPQTVLAKHAVDPPTPVRAARPSVPVPVDAAVSRALAKLPADRFPTAQQFADALDAPSLSAALARGRRHLPGVLLAGIALAVAAVAAAALLRRGRSPPTPPGAGVLVLPRAGAAAPDLRVATIYRVLAGAVEWLPGIRVLDGSALADSSAGPPSPHLLGLARQMGARYLLVGSLESDGAAPIAAVELYGAGSGERIARSQAPAAGAKPAAAFGRAAMQAARTLAGRERIPLGAKAALFDATGTAVTLARLLEGQTQFWQGHFDAAADAFRAAIDADSTCALAYHRLSVAHVWRHDYPAALAAALAGLAIRPAPAPRWRALLDAQRLYVLSEGDSAVAGFQAIVADEPRNADAWLGLGESLFHFAPTMGHRRADALPAFERLVALDSTFAPIYDHVVDLALRSGDLARAESFLRLIPADDPSRPARLAAVALRRTTGAERAGLLDSLEQADRYTVSDLVALLASDSGQAELADTIAAMLGGPNRTPDDRRRAADYRLAILGRLGRWSDGLAIWQARQPTPLFDGWLVLAALAGFPAESAAAPMLAWARNAAAARQAPDFSLPPTHEYQQGFQALVARATVAGDSAQTLWLLQRIESAPASPDPSDGVRETLETSLRARLALLAHDTAAATGLLRRSVVRIPERYVTFLPLAGMAPQRFLLAELAARRHDSAEAERWLSTFTDGWAVADILYDPAARRLRAELHP